MVLVRCRGYDPEAEWLAFQAMTISFRGGRELLACLGGCDGAPATPGRSYSKNVVCQRIGPSGALYVVGTRISGASWLRLVVPSLEVRRGVRRRLVLDLLERALDPVGDGRLQLTPGGTNSGGVACCLAVGFS